MMCRDRFRLELSQNGLVAYVNGQRYFEDSGWPARNQLPTSITNGSTPVYVYLSDWEDTPNQPAYRFHWQRFAVNPHNADGTIVAPSVAPSFCLGQEHNTCGMSVAPAPAAPAVVVGTPSQGDLPQPADTDAAPQADQPQPVAAAAPAPLLGDAGLQPTRDSNPQGTAEAFRFVATRSDTASRLQLYVDASNQADRIVLGLYDSTGDDHPGHLLASSELSSPAADAWNSADIPPVALTGGSTYWLAVLGPADTGMIGLRDVNEGGDQSEISRQTGLTTLPDVWSSGQEFGSSPISAYADTAQ
jgi:hypothetical protein